MTWCATRPDTGCRPTATARACYNRAWLLSGGAEPALDADAGLRRARAATLLMLALPGSAYLYQGEELGLGEVAAIPAEARQDPTFFRSPGVDVGRDGCRVPIPWTEGGDSFGFGTADAHLPQPEWFGSLSVEAQSEDPSSTLNLYREALALRHRLQSDESLTWVDSGRRGAALPPRQRMGGRGELRRDRGAPARGRGAPRERPDRRGGAAARDHGLGQGRFVN